MTEHLTSEAQGLFAVLRQSADPEAVAEIERFVAEASDRELCRVNVIDFAARRRLDEERVIAAFLHAARLGIFELSWNVLCPGCGGVLDTSTTLKSVNKDEYDCAWCAAGYTPILDEIVEVTFTISRRVRRIAAHDPDELPFAEYFRQVFWGSGIDVPDGKAPADKPGFSRCLRHRYDRRRSAPQDHQPDLPVHRSQRLDRALRARRRPGRLRPGAGALSRAQRDHRRGGGRGRQDH